MMKVLHITARADLGGGPRHIQYLIQSIGDDVNNYIACPADEPFYSIYSNMLGNEKLHLIPHRKFSISAALSLGNFIKKNNIATIHCHGKGAAVYGKFLKLKYAKLNIIYTPHGVNISLYKNIKRLLYVIYEKTTAKLFKHIIYVSHSEAELALSKSLFGKTPYTVINNGVPAFTKPEVNIQDLKRSIFGEDSREVILTFSRFDYQKNMQEALAVAKKLPQYNFLWVGYGDDYKPLQLEINSANLKNVFMIGAKNDVKNYLALSDVYLSTARWEGMPLALLEAMSAGLPIVASNVIGNKNIVNSSTGYLYNPGDVNDAVEKLKSTIENKFDQNAILQYFQNEFSADIMSRKILGIYKSIR